MFHKLKDYRALDDQSDILGKAEWEYVKKLHLESHKQTYHLLPFMYKYVKSRLLRKPLKFSSRYFQRFSIAIDPAQGRLLYSLVAAKKPNVIVEYGTSFGISTIYMAAALKNLKTGHIIGTEIEPEKVQIALSHLDNCGLSEYATVKVGNALETLATITQEIDMVLMDGFPDLNLGVLKVIEPKLAQGCLIVTDDAYLFQTDMKSYLSYLEQSKHYSSQIIPVSDGMVITVKLSPASYQVPPQHLPSAAEDCATAQQESISKTSD